MKCVKCGRDAADRVTLCLRCVHSLPVTLGLDLGQSQDHSALAGVRKLPLRVPIFRRRFMYSLVKLEEYPLGASYPDQVRRTVETLSSPAFKGSKCGVDYTGVGRPVFDMLREARPPVLLYPVLTTGGHAVTYEPRTRELHVPKSEQVSLAQVLIQGGLLSWSPKLSASPRLKDQLLRYKMKTTEAKNQTFGGEGVNDDLVSAVMTACYIAERFGGGSADGATAAEPEEGVAGGAPDGVFVTGKGV